MLPISQELFRVQPQEAAAAPSLLMDFLHIIMEEDQLAAVASSLKGAAIAAASHCPSPLAHLLYGLQETLQSAPSTKVLQACGSLFNIFVAEFLCCCTVYMVNAILTLAAFHFNVKHRSRISLAVLLVAVAAGLPHCTVVGEPFAFLLIGVTSSSHPPLGNSKLQASWKVMNII